LGLAQGIYKKFKRIQGGPTRLRLAALSLRLVAWGLMLAAWSLRPVSLGLEAWSLGPAYEPECKPCISARSELTAFSVSGT